MERIEDMFWICREGEENLQNFYHFLNSFYPAEKITKDFSEGFMNTLDAH